MMRDGFVLRHDPREVIRRRCSRSRARFWPARLWLADAYVLAGEIDKAQALFDRVVGIANDLGLLAEEYDSVRAAPDRQFSAGADPYRADQHRAQSQPTPRHASEKPAMQRSK